MVRRNPEAHHRIVKIAGMRFVVLSTFHLFAALWPQEYVARSKCLPIPELFFWIAHRRSFDGHHLVLWYILLLRLLEFLLNGLQSPKPSLILKIAFLYKPLQRASLPLLDKRYLTDALYFHCHKREVFFQKPKFDLHVLSSTLVLHLPSQDQYSVPCLFVAFETMQPQQQKPLACRFHNQSLEALPAEDCHHHLPNH